MAAVTAAAETRGDTDSSEGEEEEEDQKMLKTQQCRICGKLGDRGIPLLLPQREKLREWIRKYLSVEVSSEDNYTDKVCFPCLKTIQDWITFHAHCQKAQRLHFPLPKKADDADSPTVQPAPARQEEQPVPQRSEQPSQKKDEQPQQKKDEQPQQKKDEQPQQMKDEQPQQKNDEQPPQKKDEQPPQKKDEPPSQKKGEQPQQKKDEQSLQKKGEQPQQKKDEQSSQKKGEQPQQKTGKEHQQPSHQKGAQPSQRKGEQPQQKTGKQPQQPSHQKGEQPSQQKGEQPSQQKGEQPSHQKGEQPQKKKGEQPSQKQGGQPTTAKSKQHPSKKGKQPSSDKAKQPEQPSSEKAKQPEKPVEQAYNKSEQLTSEQPSCEKSAEQPNAISDNKILSNSEDEKTPTKRMASDSDSPAVVKRRNRNRIVSSSEEEESPNKSTPPHKNISLSLTARTRLNKRPISPNDSVPSKKFAGDLRPVIQLKRLALDITSSPIILSSSSSTIAAPSPTILNSSSSTIAAPSPTRRPKKKRKRRSWANKDSSSGESEESSGSDSDFIPPDEELQELRGLRTRQRTVTPEPVQPRLRKPAIIDSDDDMPEESSTFDPDYVQRSDSEDEVRNTVEPVPEMVSSTEKAPIVSVSSEKPSDSSEKLPVSVNASKEKLPVSGKAAMIPEESLEKRVPEKSSEKRVSLTITPKDSPSVEKDATETSNSSETLSANSPETLTVCPPESVFLVESPSQVDAMEVESPEPEVQEPQNGSPVVQESEFIDVEEANFPDSPENSTPKITAVESLAEKAPELVKEKAPEPLNEKATEPPKPRLTINMNKLMAPTKPIDEEKQREIDQNVAAIAAQLRNPTPEARKTTEIPFLETTPEPEIPTLLQAITVPQATSLRQSVLPQMVQPRQASAPQVLPKPTPPNRQATPPQATPAQPRPSVSSQIVGRQPTPPTRQATPTQILARQPTPPNRQPTPPSRQATSPQISTAPQISVRQPTPPVVGQSPPPNIQLSSPHPLRVGTLIRSGSDLYQIIRPATPKPTDNTTLRNISHPSAVIQPPTAVISPNPITAPRGPSIRVVSSGNVTGGPQIVNSFSLAQPTQPQPVRHFIVTTNQYQEPTVHQVVAPQAAVSPTQLVQNQQQIRNQVSASQVAQQTRPVAVSMSQLVQNQQQMRPQTTGSMSLLVQNQQQMRPQTTGSTSLLVQNQQQMRPQTTGSTSLLLQNQQQMRPQTTGSTSLLVQNQQQMKPQTTGSTSQLHQSLQQMRTGAEAAVPITQMVQTETRTIATMTVPRRPARSIAQTTVSTPQLAQNETKTAAQNQQPSRSMSQTAQSAQNQQPVGQTTAQNQQTKAQATQSVKNVDYETAQSIANHPKFHILSEEHKAKVMEVLANPPSISESPEVIDLDDDDGPSLTENSKTVQKKAESSSRDVETEGRAAAETAVRAATTEVAPAKESAEFVQPQPPKPAKEKEVDFRGMTADALASLGLVIEPPSPAPPRAESPTQIGTCRPSVVVLSPSARNVDNVTQKVHNMPQSDSDVANSPTAISSSEMQIHKMPPGVKKPAMSPTSHNESSSSSPHSTTNVSHNEVSQTLRAMLENGRQTNVQSTLNTGQATSTNSMPLNSNQNQANNIVNSNTYNMPPNSTQANPVNNNNKLPTSSQNQSNSVNNYNMPLNLVQNQANSHSIQLQNQSNSVSNSRNMPVNSSQIQSNSVTQNQGHSLNIPENSVSSQEPPTNRFVTNAALQLQNLQKSFSTIQEHLSKTAKWVGEEPNKFLMITRMEVCHKLMLDTYNLAVIVNRCDFSGFLTQDSIDQLMTKIFKALDNSTHNLFDKMWTAVNKDHLTHRIRPVDKILSWPSTFREESIAANALFCIKHYIECIAEYIRRRKNHDEKYQSRALAYPQNVQNQHQNASLYPQSGQKPTQNHPQNALTYPNQTQNAQIHPQNALTYPNQTQNAQNHPQNALTYPNQTQNAQNHPQNALIYPNQTQNAQNHPQNALTYPNQTQNAQNHPQNALTYPNQTQNYPQNALTYPQNNPNHSQVTQNHQNMQNHPQNALAYPQNGQNQLQNALTYPNQTQNAQNLQNHPQNALTYPQNVSNYNQNAPNHQNRPQNAINYRPNVSNYNQRQPPNYPQNVTTSQNSPSYCQNAPHRYPAQSNQPYYPQYQQQMAAPSFSSQGHPRYAPPPNYNPAMVQRQTITTTREVTTEVTHTNVQNSFESVLPEVQPTIAAPVNVGALHQPISNATITAPVNANPLLFPHQPILNSTIPANPSLHHEPILNSTIPANPSLHHQPILNSTITAPVNTNPSFHHQQPILNATITSPVSNNTSLQHQQPILNATVTAPPPLLPIDQQISNLIMQNSALTSLVRSNPNSLSLRQQSTITSPVTHQEDPPTRIDRENIWSIVDSIIEEETNSAPRGLAAKLVTQKSLAGDKVGYYNVLTEPITPEVNNNDAEIANAPIVSKPKQSEITPICKEKQRNEHTISTAPDSTEKQGNQCENSADHPITAVVESSTQKRRHQSENEFESTSHLTIQEEKSRKRHQSEKSKKIVARRSTYPSDNNVTYTSRRPSLEDRLPDMPGLNDNNLDSLFETQETRIQCAKCDQYFTDYNELLAHHEVHTQSEKSSMELSTSQILEDIRNTLTRQATEDYNCSYCGKVFQNQSEMEGHISTSHLGVNIYQCIHCPNRFSSRNGLNTHMMNKHTGKYSYNCNNCDKVFMTKLELLRHNAQTHEMFISKKQCSVCQKSFKTLSGLDRHKEKEHGVVSENVPMISNVFDTAKTQQALACCKHCTEEFNTEDELISHCRKAHKHMSKKKTVGCNYCSRKFKTKEELDKHCKRVHKNLSVFAIVKPSKHTISCKYCREKFNDNESLYVHCKRNHRHLWFCDECRFTASKETQLKTHKLKHESSKLAEEFQKLMEERERESSFPCPYCDENFVDDAERAVHSNEAHSQEFPYPCDVCPMRHRTEELYNLHAFSHEPPKSAPVCTLCDKTFSKTSLLQEHMKWHENCEG